MTGSEEHHTLTDIIDALDAVATGEWVSVGDILHRIGERSFAPALLVPALILVSPLSGIPGLPTVGSFIVILIALQALMGRHAVWLPGFLMRRSIGTARFRSALGWLRRPLAWVDRHSANRMWFANTRPLRMLTLIVIVVIAAMWPMLEFLPLVTSIGAFAVSLLAVGLLTRDGLYVIAGYVFVGVLAAALLGVF